MDSLFNLRNRIFRSPRFQAWASAFPLTRPIALRRSRALFDLCAGFVYSQTLLACVELDVLEFVRDGPLSRDDLVSHIGLEEEAALRLLKAAAALEILEFRGDDRIGLGPHGAALFGVPSVLDMIRHHRLLYDDLRDPVGLLRDRQETRLSAFWAYATDTERKTLTSGDTDDYSRLMASTQRFIARDVAAAHDLSRYGHIMDVGGGHGAFLIEVGNSIGSRLTLFDLPAVAEAGAEKLAAAGLSSRSGAVGGDFFLDDLPADADLVTLVRILHDHDDGDLQRLLSNIRRSLKPGGRLLVAEPMAQTRAARAMGDAYFGWYLWAMGSGRPRSRAELTKCLKAAGFNKIRYLRPRNPLLVQVLLAE